jgi:hypothetical protein
MLPVHGPPYPGIFGVPQRDYYSPESARRLTEEQKHLPDRDSGSVRLPHLQNPLRYAQPIDKRKHLQPQKKRKRIRPSPVVREYEHLSVEEAVQELARRDIHINIRQVDVNKAILVRLLQRADRNNNTGTSNLSEAKRTVARR